MYNEREARDCLRGASPKRVSKLLLTREWFIHFDNGASVVVSEWESHLQGEGRQVIRYLKEGGTRDA
jgi:hypothetical protein